MPQEILEQRFDTNIFEVALYRNESIDQKFGNDPEYTAVNHIAPALFELGVNHRIWWDFDPVPLTNNDNQCPQSSGTTTAYEEWGDYLRGGNLPIVAADANQLLTDSSGGCTSVGGNVGVSPAWKMDEGRQSRQRTAIQGPRWQSNMYSILHEIGHNMGFPHSPHPGITWTDDDGTWNKTPAVGNGVDTENVCGLSIDPKPGQGEDTRVHLYYTSCAGDEMKITDSGMVQVTDVSVTPEVTDGEDVTVTATMENTTAHPAVLSKDVFVGDRSVGTMDFSVSPDSTRSAEVTFTPSSRGTHPVTVGKGSSQVQVTGIPGLSRRGLATAGVGAAVLFVVSTRRLGSK